MKNLNIKSKSKKIISLATLASVCLTIPFMYSQTNANAGIFSRFFSGIRTGGSVVNATRAASSSNPTRNTLGSAARRLSTASRITSNVNTTNQNSSSSPTIVRTNSVSNSTNQNLTSLSQRLDVLEANQMIDIQRANHPFNKAVMTSGLIASAAMVAGVVGGIVQQSKFTQFTKEQTEKDQEVQEDLNNMKNHFQKNEVPEAEQYIIDYYQENFGVDISNKS